ncbi:MAG: sugar ABC transporter permease [Firmicutes bacterium]|nr:sugar ABC transporter permease [Bacillota bacterium]
MTSGKRQSRTMQFTLFAMIIPSLALILLFSYYPAIRSLVGSLTFWNGFDPPQFIGLQNFIAYFQMPGFGAQIRNLALLLLGGIVTLMVFPFLGAELTQSVPWMRVRRYVQWLFAVPMVVPQVILVAVWGYLLNPYDGVVDQMLSLFRVPPIQWLGNSHTALISILLIGFPWVTSLAYLVFLSGLQAIPQDIYEAARVDGSTGLERIWHLDVPLIIPQLRFVIIITGITMVQNFVPILLLTSGGPGNATAVPGLEMYQAAFSNSQFGFGMAIGTLLFLFMLVISILTLKFLKPQT